MQARLFTLAPLPGPPGPRCPQCKRKLVRTQRHLSDRIVSLFTPVHRYCCIEFGCHWEGRIRVSAIAADERHDVRLKSGDRPLA